MVKKSDLKIVKKEITGNWIDVKISLNGKIFSFSVNDTECKETVLIHGDTDFKEITLADGQNWRVEATDCEGHIYDIRKI